MRTIVDRMNHEYCELVDIEDDLKADLHLQSAAHFVQEARAKLSLAVDRVKLLQAYNTPEKFLAGYEPDSEKLDIENPEQPSFTIQELEEIV